MAARPSQRASVSQRKWFPPQTQGLESLRELIRSRGAEQLNGQMERKIERRQVEVDVIKVRF
jgi:hypothetical protein